MLSLLSWHLANRSKSKKQGWFCPPAEPACLNWNFTSRLSEVVSSVHKQSPCQCKCTSNMYNPSGIPSCTYKGLVVRVEKLPLVFNNMFREMFFHVPDRQDLQNWGSLYVWKYGSVQQLVGQAVLGQFQLNMVVYSKMDKNLCSCRALPIQGSCKLTLT